MKRKVTRVAANPGCSAATLFRSARFSSRLAGRGQVFFLHTPGRNGRSDNAAQPFSAADAGAETPALISRTAHHTLETDIGTDHAVLRTLFRRTFLQNIRAIGLKFHQKKNFYLCFCISKVFQYRWFKLNYTATYCNIFKASALFNLFKYI